MTTIPYRPSLNTFGPSLIRAIFDAAPPDALNMGLGMPDSEVPASVIAAVHIELATKSALYSPNAGRLELRQQIAAMYTHWSQKTPGVASWVKPEGVVVTSGAQEALYVALASLCELGSEVLVPDPGFPAYAMIARCIGARVATYRLRPEDHFRTTAEAISKALTPNTRAVVLGSPANPTGAMIDSDEMQSIALVLAAAGVPYISDEIYDRYTWSSSFVSPGRFSDLGIVVSGLSKSIGIMGWRLGWLIVPPGQARVPTAVHQSICTSASNLSQAGAVAALDALMERGPDATVLNCVLDRFRDRRQRVLAAIQTLGLNCTPADGAFYLFAEIAPHLKNGEDGVGFCQRLARDHGVIVIPGEGFGPGGAGWIRIAYTCDAIEEGVRRIGEGLAQ